MIIQDHGDHLRVIDQHDHALLSGELAREWVDPETGRECRFELVLATAFHDMAWLDADARPVFSPETGRPYDFLSYPESPKLDVYDAGIHAMERFDLYAAYLHSLHFLSFASEQTHPAAYARAAHRSETLRARCDARGLDLTHVEEELDLLRLFDVFSLLMCMTGPDITRQPPRWLNPSLQLAERGLTIDWEDGDVVITPYCFRRAFSVQLPYRDVKVSTSGRVEPTALYRAPKQLLTLTVRPSRHA